MKQKKLPAQTETQIKKAIKQFLDLRGVWHFPVLQGLGCYKGMPDMFAVRSGVETGLLFPVVYAIEVKTEKGNLSEHQERFMEMWELRGLPYLVARSIEDVAEAMGLEKIGGRL